MWELAQLNVARLLIPLDSPEMAEFVAAFDPINAQAEAAPGFVWRLANDSGPGSHFTKAPGIDDPTVVANYSIWVDVESLKQYVHHSDHMAYLQRRQEWFKRPNQASTVCWWIPAGERPPLTEAMKRLTHLRNYGPSSEGWPLHKAIPAPLV